MDIGEQKADGRYQKPTSLIEQTLYKTFPYDDTAYGTIRVARDFATENIQTYDSNQSG